MRTGGSAILTSTWTLDPGIPKQKDPDHPRELVIECMLVDLQPHPECESIYRAGTSGAARLPAPLSWTAGAGSAGATGTAPPAINRPSGGEFPEGEEGISPHMRTHGARREPQERLECRLLLPELQEQARQEQLELRRLKLYE